MNNEATDLKVILILNSFMFPLIYIFNLFYIEGDQENYRQAYELVKGLKIGDAYSIYNGRIDGSRYPHLILNWVMSSLGISKEASTSFLNIILISYSYIYFRKIGVSISISVILIITNFYFWVTYTTVEMLRVGCIFLVLSLLYKDKIFLSLCFAILALTSHQSLIFIYSGMAGCVAYSNIFKIKTRIKLETLLFLIITVLFLILFFFFYKDILLHKIKGYVNLDNVFIFHNYLPCLFLIFCSIVCYKKIINPIICYLPCLMGIALMGPARVNMLAFMISIFFITKNNNGNNVFFYFLSLIMLYKTVLYLKSIYVWGHGFG